MADLVQPCAVLGLNEINFYGLFFIQYLLYHDNFWTPSIINEKRNVYNMYFHYQLIIYHRFTPSYTPTFDYKS